MAQRLRRLTLDRVDLVDRGANPGAHITLFKRDNIEPAAAGNNASKAFVNKAARAYPGVPIADAINRYAAERPDEYQHASNQTKAGTQAAYTPPALSTAPVLKRETATALIERTAATVRKHLMDLTVAQSIDLASRLRPDWYSAHAGRPLVRKSGPPSETQLEDQLLREYLTVRDALRRGADKQAATAIGHDDGAADQRVAE